MWPGHDWLKALWRGPVKTEKLEKSGSVFRRIRTIIRSIFAKHEINVKHDHLLTSRIAKLVKWLQLQTVSLSVLFLTKQPLEFQPPDPSAS